MYLSIIIMDWGKGKGKKGMISKTWERCKSFSLMRKPLARVVQKSKSWPRGLVVPEGCFSIYVGPERERFVIKTKYVNHPLFRALLEEAESEYGYSSDGPLLLPCQVHHFLEMMARMECHKNIHSAYHLLTPPRSSNLWIPLRIRDWEVISSNSTTRISMCMPCLSDFWVTNGRR